MNVDDISAVLGTIAPLELAADWDNAGLLIGDGRDSVRRLMLCIDLTDAVLDECARCDVQMVMAYHPVIFQPLARLTAAAAPVALRAARMGLSVYSMHTALDAAPGGTNDVLADTLKLADRRALEPLRLQGQVKIVAFVPPDDLQDVADAAFAAGAGTIGDYDRCSFFSHGVGTFQGREGTHPAIGQAGRQEAAEELRVEFVAPARAAADVLAAIRQAHSYEEPAVDVYPLERHDAELGMGRIGSLPAPATLKTVLARLKKATGLKRLWVALPDANTPATDARPPATIRKAAVCAGSAGSLALEAARQGAELYVTGEMRHHDALAAAAAGMTCICLGHSNSERLALPPLARRIADSLPDLKVLTSKTDADPLQIL